MHYKFLQYFITSNRNTCLQNGLYIHEKIKPNTEHLHFQKCLSSHIVMALWLNSLPLYATYENISLYMGWAHDTASMILQLANAQCVQPQDMWLEIWMEDQAHFYSCSTNLESISGKIFSDPFCCCRMLACSYSTYFMYLHSTGEKNIFLSTSYSPANWTAIILSYLCSLCDDWSSQKLPPAGGYAFLSTCTCLAYVSKSLLSGYLSP
jgi:hypothetical protein